MLLMFFSAAVVRRYPVQNVRPSGTQTWASSLISAALGWNAEVHSRARWGAEARMAHAYTQVMAAAGELWKSAWRAHSVLFQCLDYTYQKACKQEGEKPCFLSAAMTVYMLNVPNHQHIFWAAAVPSGGCLGMRSYRTTEICSQK